MADRVASIEGPQWVDSHRWGPGRNSPFAAPRPGGLERRVFGGTLTSALGAKRTWLHVTPSDHPHDRVAFLSSGVSASLKGLKPELAANSGCSLAAQLRRARRAYSDRQIDAASAMGVSVETLGNWENGRTEPEVQMYPAIIRYLGSEPWKEPSTLAEALIAERRRRGLSVARAAVVLGVDEETLGRWESGTWKPQPQSRRRIRSFLAATGPNDRF